MSPHFPIRHSDVGDRQKPSIELLSSVSNVFDLKEDDVDCLHKVIVYSWVVVLHVVFTSNTSPFAVDSKGAPASQFSESGRDRRMQCCRVESRDEGMKGGGRV